MRVVVQVVLLNLYPASQRVDVMQGLRHDLLLLADWHYLDPLLAAGTAFRFDFDELCVINAIEELAVDFVLRVVFDESIERFRRLIAISELAFRNKVLLLLLGEPGVGVRLQGDLGGSVLGWNGLHPLF